VAEAVADRARASSPAAEVAREVSALLPPQPVDALAAVATSRHFEGKLAFMDLLEKCLEDAEQIRAYARSPDGTIRNARLILAASQHLRQTIETAARVQETLCEIADVDQFHREVIRAIETESPACAERLVSRLRQLNNAWSMQHRRRTSSVA
jgi:hypothetical protein